MELHLKGKHVLISGSSMGIGFAIAEKFLQEGAKVCVTGRNENDLTTAKNRLESLFPEAEITKFACDFTLDSSVASLCTFIRQQWGKLDVLITNVGSGKSVSSSIPDEDEFARVMSTNFTSSVTVIRYFLEMLREAGGVVTAISSIAGIEAISAPTAYTVSKAALNAFTKTLSRQFSTTGVRINTVAPGNILCESGSWANRLANEPESTMNYISSHVPLNRFGRPEEIASLVCFLSSPVSSFINGAIVVADGGQTVGI